MPGVVEKPNSWFQWNLFYSACDFCDEPQCSSSAYTDMKAGQRMHFSNGHSSDNLGASRYDEDGPRYMLEHLATFSVGPEFGLVSPKDGLRRLLQMEKTNGIWTQKMQMKLEKDWVIILDYEDGDIVERFPMNLISDPTAYTSDDPRELYNNILVFIVREDPKNKNPNPSEMHIFQCSRVFAQDVVDEMKMFMSGKVKAKYSDNMRHLPPPPQNPPPEPPVNGNNSKVKEHVAVFSTSVGSASSARPQLLHGAGSNHQQRVERNISYARESNDETSSTTSEKYEREVTILNHCFDDIERFVVRLQHAAAAYKELERRQKSRKNKKKDMGDGMLSIRAKPPPEREFIDILQKFKLSFNLLAKLKSHIHDPNAPELVHFLFTPLALIVDAAHDANHSANVAARVVSPLLTRDAIDLLTNCCTSKETDLWHSLGDSWIIPRDQWKGYESSYHPIFSNGWAPENPIDENSSIGHRLHRAETELREQDYQRVFSHPERESHYGSECFSSERGDDQDTESPAALPEHSRIQQPYEQQFDHRSADLRREILDRSNMLSESGFHDPRDRDVRSEFSSDSIERGDISLNPQRQFDRQQMQWLEELKSRRAKIVQVVYPRTANNDKELTVIRGEILEILDDSRKWWKARNMRGQVAHVPHTIVSSYPSADDDVFSNPMYATRSSRESYYSAGDTAVKDHYVDDSPRSQDSPRSPPSTSQTAPAEWVRRERQGCQAKFSGQKEIGISSDKQNTRASFTIGEYEANPFNAKSSSAAATVCKSRESLGELFPPERHQGDQGVHSFADRSTEHVKSVDHAKLQTELKASMTKTKVKKVWKRIGCPKHLKSDCFYITQNSADADVIHWLQLKGFNQSVVDGLRSVTAEDLFKMTKEELVKRFGNEGSRLHSNLTVQKELFGFKTHSASELGSILEKRRQRSE